MITSRFEYNTIDRISQHNIRYYNTVTGMLPSVTSILSRTQSERTKKALDSWRSLHNSAKILEEASSRGTRMHKFLEDYIAHDTLSKPGSNPYSIESHLMASTIIKHAFPNIQEIWGSEVNLYYPHLYAGTTDLCGVFDNKESIMDFKQSNKPKTKERVEDYYIQLTAYGTAHNILYNTKIRQGVLFICVKPVYDNKYNIIKPPEYQQFSIKDSEWDHYVDKMWDKVEQYYLEIV